ncbi:Predicted regulator of Ras-like GTPase activity, Roadblock/LC7/MglB family [Amycolatopsis tolypomycina]|uniref:Predicted regulator of Ras-like GTPase activity, Roadblock/LC7/MglB family n=1 Tax=Amycolatopsis tolypomycina TaxID=208445 RepID=A0A1H4JME9_9PSEU|nr:roadblock/LC7 domain-containing protein [Amycolatopsis tolypomycina]SEB47490.1 Predicted regulator of Ras-like GTPase activity, Roadblock/LC7/MglB family [Amycolatopsis tolypomycina]
MTSTQDPWMLGQLQRIESVRFCLVVSTDGLVLKKPDELDKDRADLLAAACAAVLASASAVKGPAGFEGAFQQNFSQWSDGFLFVRRAGEGTCLAVVTDENVNPGLLAHAMAERIKQVGESTLSTSART